MFALKITNERHMTVCIAFIFNIKGGEIHEGGGIATLEKKTK